MEKQTIALLNEVVRNTEMGKITLRQLLGIVEDERLKTHIHRQLATYQDLSKRAHAMLAVEGQAAQNQNPMTCLSAKMGVTMQTLRDNSPRKVAQMLIEGNQVGVTDMTMALRDAPQANPGAVALAQRLRQAENEYASQLSTFL